MIFDSLENLKKYTIISHIDNILEFLHKTDVFSLSIGDILIKGKDLYVKVLRYIPKDSSENYFETHKNHTDVQIIFEGIEKMQVVNSDYLEETNEFKLEGDFKFYKASENISEFVVMKNEFAVFFPGEPHKPGCKYNSSDKNVLKLVFKVKVKKK